MVSKRTQGEIITVVLIILVVIAGIVIVWNAVKKVIQDMASGIETEILSVELKISKVVIFYGNPSDPEKKIQFAVERGNDNAEVAKLLVYIIGKDASGNDLTQMYELKSPANPVPAPLETRIYNYFDISDFQTNSIIKIIVYSVSPKGKKGIAATYIVTGKEPTNPTALGVGGVDWSKGNPIIPVGKTSCVYSSTWTDMSPITCCNAVSGSGLGRIYEVQERVSGDAGICDSLRPKRCVKVYAACDSHSGSPSPPPSGGCSYSSWVDDENCYTGGCSDPTARRQTRSVFSGSGCFATSQCIFDDRCQDGCYAPWGYGWGYGCGYGDMWGCGEGVCCTASGEYGYVENGCGYGCGYGYGFGYGYGCKCYNFVEGYEDSDGDGYGYGYGEICSGDGLPSGYSSYSYGEDCDDSNPEVWQMMWGYEDNDNDGYGWGEGDICSGYGLPYGYSVYGEDCDDSNPEVWQMVWGYEDWDYDGYYGGYGEEMCFGYGLPSGYSSYSYGEDCDDSNPEVWQMMGGYEDWDNDGCGYGYGEICSGDGLPDGYSSYSYGDDCDENGGWDSSCSC